MTRFRLALLLAFLTAAGGRADEPKLLTKIAFGSCADQDKPLPIFDTIAATKPELLLLIGDNIYADLDRGRKVTPEVILEKYEALAKLPGFQKLKATCPILATWDDHDLGKNDAGAEFPFKDESQKLFLDFFGIAANDPRRTQKGVYSSAIYGPEGKRVRSSCWTRATTAARSRRHRTIRSTASPATCRTPTRTRPC